MKSFPASFLLLLVAAAMLAGCGSLSDSASLTPMPGDVEEPEDSVMRESVTAFLEDSGAPVSSMYEYRRIDLDRDGRRDALVLFKNPYGYWCDQNGCTMLVMKAEEDDFTLINAIQPVRAPLYVSDSGTNGWKSIIMRVEGRWNAETRDVAMMFDGSHYPENPDGLPAYARFAEKPRETRVFY